LTAGMAAAIGSLAGAFIDGIGISSAFP
jgi:hypothetical protein